MTRRCWPAAAAGPRRWRCAWWWPWPGSPPQRNCSTSPGAHIDACLFHGYAGLDFAELLVRGGGRVRVPTTLNLSSLDLLHRDRYRGNAHTAAAARRLMDSYVAMGARATWTCAPYQLPTRLGLGEHRQSETRGQDR